MIARAGAASAGMWSIFRCEHDGENTNCLLRIAWIFAAFCQGLVVVVDFPEDTFPAMLEPSEVALAMGSLSGVKSLNASTFSRISD